jgi:hypothetical protein
MYLQVKSHVMGGGRLRYHALKQHGVPKWVFKQCIEPCWEFSGVDRPSFNEIAERLESWLGDPRVGSGASALMSDEELPKSMCAPCVVPPPPPSLTHMHTHTHTRTHTHTPSPLPRTHHHHHHHPPPPPPAPPPSTTSTTTTQISHTLTWHPLMLVFLPHFTHVPCCSPDTTQQSISLSA